MRGLEQEMYLVHPLQQCTCMSCNWFPTKVYCFHECLLTQFWLFALNISVCTDIEHQGNRYPATRNSASPPETFTQQLNMSGTVTILQGEAISPKVLWNNLSLEITLLWLLPHLPSTNELLIHDVDNNLFMGSLEPPSSKFSIGHIFYFAKVKFRSFPSLPYLTDMSKMRLRRHMSNMNVILNRQTVLWLRKNMNERIVLQWHHMSITSNFSICSPLCKSNGTFF